MEQLCKDNRGYRVACSGYSTQGRGLCNRPVESGWVAWRLFDIWWTLHKLVMCMHYLAHMLCLKLTYYMGTRRRKLDWNMLILQFSFKRIGHVLFKAFFRGNLYLDNTILWGYLRQTSWKHGDSMFYSFEKHLDTSMLRHLWHTLGKHSLQACKNESFACGHIGHI